MPDNGLIVKMIYEGSVAQEAGIEIGDLLLSINKETGIDSIIYRYLICDEKISMVFRNKSGEEYEVDIEKEQYEDIGIEFEDPCLENSLSCRNKCIFCFIDQLPKGMRSTLYFKDDDSRLSFLQGNFITLTNLKDEDFERIIKYKISPINVSVHTTNPELRVRMLSNKRASELIPRLKQLVDGGIKLNCQIVLCPGINDGLELEKSLMDLSSLYPGIMSVAIVPVGITRFREGLFNMEGYDEESASKVIMEVAKLQNFFYENYGDNFARLSDEFYITAGVQMPDYEHYADFEQLEDGIGMTRYFENTVLEELDYFESEFKGNNEAFALITGEMCGPDMVRIAAQISERLNLKIKVYSIKNNFFGGKVSVAGLLTGKDIIDQTTGILKEKVLLMPRNMLKADEDVFLDDIKLEQIEEALEAKVIICKYTGEDLIENIINEVREWQNQ